MAKSGKLQSNMETHLGLNKGVGFLVASLLGHHKAALNFGFKFAKPKPGKLKFLI